MTVRRPGLVVAMAIVLSMPMAPGVLDGAIDPTDALLRFLVALLLCWMAASGVGSVFRRYSEQNRRAELRRMMEEAHRVATERAANDARLDAANLTTAVGPGPSPAPAGMGTPPRSSMPAMPSAPTLTTHPAPTAPSGSSPATPSGAAGHPPPGLPSSRPLS